MDKFIHGTTTHGERQNHAKLKEWQVMEIRALAGKMTNREIAEMYGVTPGPIWHIITRRTWKYLP